MAVPCVNWEEFEQEIKKLRIQFNKATAPLIFRGQGNSEWKLETTLERNARESKMLVSDYYRLTNARLSAELKTFADIEIPLYLPDLSFNSLELFSMPPHKFPDIANYQYMAYLRHLGFPSPLLDWSRSPYVAAFFAFREQIDNVEKRRIYIYCETATGIRGGAVGESSIYRMGPYVHTHHRHFRQRCDYTICGEFDSTCDQWRYSSHEYVFAHRRRDQDLLWVFDIPSSERIKVLRTLNDYNLNCFSLFGSEESLLESMWVREYILREPLSA